MSDLVYRRSCWQDYCYDEQVKAQPEIARLEKAGSAKVSAAWPTFQREVFSRLYEPGTPKLEVPVPGAGWAEKFHADAEELPEWRRLRSRVAGDPWMSALATQSVGEALKDAAPDNARQEQDPGALAEQAGALGDLPDGPAKADAEEAIRRMLEEAQQSAEAIVGSMSDEARRGMIRAACEKAIGEVNAVEAALAGCGYDASAGSGNRTGAAVKQALAARLGASPRLRRIAELAGRFRRAASAKVRAHVRHGAGELSDIEQGADLSRMLPVEALGLVEPELELLFFRRYQERQLLQYKLTEKPPEGRGPIVFCCDESGSMEGDKDMWAKAIFAGVFEVAQKQKRMCALVHFASRVCGVDVFGPNADPKALLDALERFDGGGTDFDAPLVQAVRLIDTDKRFGKADIIFLTDGEAAVPTMGIAALKQARQKRPINVFGVGIDSGHSAVQVLKTFCDEVEQVRDMVREAVRLADKMYEAVI